MKSIISVLLVVIYFGLSAQTFTKFNNPAISSINGDWYAATPIDFDNNYTLDIFMGNNGPNGVFVNSDSLNFTFDNSSTFVSQSGNSYGSYWADLDNDCDMDVFWVNNLGNGNNYLYENNGDGTFTRVTASTLKTDALNGVTGSWGDFNSDGLVDLHVSRRSGSSGLIDYIYKNTGNFNFTRIDTGATAISSAPSSSSAWIDFDNDGDQDLYVANRNGVNNDFYINQGGWFIRDTSSIIAKDASNNTSCSWGDYNNDGFVDLFLGTVLGEKNQLYKNNGNGTFTKIVSGSIVNDQANSYGSLWADFDNDGYLDLFVLNGSNIWPNNNIIYHNNGNGSFSKITSGTPYTETNETVGATAADLNEDGFVDILVPNRYNKPLTIHLNDGNNNGYLHLNLFGTSSNRAAIGARVVTKSALGKQTRVIAQQTGYNNHDDLSIKMGFGSDTIIDSLTIYWPSGNTCIFTNVTPEGFYNIEEGNCVMDTVVKSAFADSTSYLNAHFTNLSRGPINRYSWDFGDGDTSDLLNPKHTYAAPGKYLVKLKVYDDYCKYRLYKDSVEVCPDTLKPGFVDTHQSLQLTFNDTSNTVAYDFLWDFGDNTTGSAKTTNHTYSQPGLFNVCLTLVDSCRSTTFCRNISVCSDTLLAGFGLVQNGFTVSFADSSLNAVNLLWNFGDNSTSTATNPSHTYTTPGTYIICQTAQDGCTSTTLCDTVDICPDSLLADFNVNPNGKTYTFSDHSLNADTYLWDFGDGTSSTLNSPSHTYQNFGTYKVCFTVTNECFTDSMCATINICDTLASGFGASANGYTISFNDSSQNATSVSWNFGDGSSSTNQNPVHNYANAGSYLVCQTVQNACTTLAFCDTVDVCVDTAVAGFSVSANGQIYSFSSGPSQNANTYLWDFGDGNFSTNQSPAHIYPAYGIYKVCLTITNDCYSDSICKMVNVCAAPGAAAYTFKNSVAPLAIQFTNNSTNAVSQFWDFGDGNTSSNKNPLNVFANPIVYNVCLTITDSCGLMDSTCQSVNLTMFSTPEWEWANALEIYPNPTNGELTVKSSVPLDQDATVELIDMTGKTVLTKKYFRNQELLKINLEFLANGLYALKITAGAEIRTVKITKY